MSNLERLVNYGCLSLKKTFSLTLFYLDSNYFDVLVLKLLFLGSIMHRILVYHEIFRIYNRFLERIIIVITIIFLYYKFSVSNKTIITSF